MVREAPKDYTTVQNAIKILLLFKDSNNELGTIDISGKVGLNKSTTSRLLSVLSYYGVLKHNKVTRKYALGKTISELNTSLSNSLSANLVGIAIPHLNHLRDTVGESICLEVLSGSATVLSYEASYPNPVQVIVGVGEVLPVHVVAGARAILAFLPDTKIEKILDGKLTRYTEKTETKLVNLKKILKEINAQRLAFDYGEFHEDIYAVAAPIFNSDKHPVAAIAMRVPKYRWKAVNSQATLDHIKNTANDISLELLCPEDYLM